MARRSRRSTWPARSRSRPKPACSSSMPTCIGLRSIATSAWTGARSPGLAEAILHEERGLARSVRRLEPLNVSVLLAGGRSAGPYELLASPRLEDVLERPGNPTITS